MDKTSGKHTDTHISKRLAHALPKAAKPGAARRLEREVKILKAACHLLAEKGHAKFSMRRVAIDTGVTLRTVQHYFPTKRELLVETVKYTLGQQYEKKYMRQWEKSHAKSSRERLLIMLDFLLRDLRSRFAPRFFFELWALALRDKDASIAVDVVYSLHRRNIESLIEDMNPNLSPQQVSHRAIIVAMLVEGMGVLLCPGRPQHDEYLGIDDEIKARLVDIVMMP